MAAPLEFFISSELQKYILGHETLQVGDTFEVRVIEVKKDGRVLIDFGKFRAVAAVKFPIRAGDKLPLVVVAKDPRLKLQLAAHAPAAAQGRDEPQEKHEPVRVFLFSFPPRQDEKKAKLKIYYTGKNGTGVKDKKGNRLSLLLSMSRLGDIRADFFQMNNDLNVTFFVKSDDIKDRIESALSQLEKNLKESFDFLVLSVIVSRKKVVEFDTEDLPPQAAAGRLDVKV